MLAQQLAVKTAGLHYICLQSSYQMPVPFHKSAAAPQHTRQLVHPNTSWDAVPSSMHCWDGVTLVVADACDSVPKSPTPTASYLAGIAMEDLWCCAIGAAPRRAFYLGLLRQQSTKLSTALHTLSGFGPTRQQSTKLSTAGYTCVSGGQHTPACSHDKKHAGRVSCDLSLDVLATHGPQEPASR